MSEFDSEPRPCASPPCFAHELVPEPMTHTEVMAFLNELLESERAGARGVTDMAKQDFAAGMAPLLREVAKDEGFFCRMLLGHIQRLGGVPSQSIGIFYDKLMAREGLDAKLTLLDRGQSAVVRMIRDALPRIVDAALVADLTHMVDVHIRNIARCATAQSDLAG
jgi:hypothetical protein